MSVLLVWRMNYGTISGHSNSMFQILICLYCILMKAGSTDATPDQPSSFWSRMRDDLRHQFLLYISICKSCNAHQGFHDIFLISEAWTYVNYEAQTAEIRHWMHPKWHCTLRRIGPAGNSGEMSIEFNDKSKNLFRSIQIQSSRASREPGFPSYQVGKASPLAFSARQDRKPGWIMAHEDWVWTCRA